MSTIQSSLLFFGTPAFAVPALRLLAENGNYVIAGVVTQPDRPAGRGALITQPPVKIAALEYGIPVLQPESLRNIHSPGGIRGERAVLTKEDRKGVTKKSEGDIDSFLDFSQALPPIDASICVAYGNIIPKALLDFAKCGTVNIHPSLLPRWRGAAPIQHTIFAGDTLTGVSLMLLDEGLDTGPVFGVRELPVLDDDIYASLHDRLAEAGASFLLEVLPRILRGECTPVLQAKEGVTYAEKWTADDALIRWNDPVAVTLRRIRASDPEPGAKTVFRNEHIRIFGARKAANRNYADAPPGTIVEVNRTEIVASTGNDQYISLDELQFPGKKRLPAAEILKGKKISPGETFS